MIEHSKVKNLHQENGSPFGSHVKIVRLLYFITLILGASLMIFKFWGARQSGSQAVLSDALESVVNVIAASLGLFVIYFASKPADKEHPYGHGKAEYFSSAFEGGLITFAGVFIIIEAVSAFLNSSPIFDSQVGLYVVVIAGVINLLLGFILVKAGDKFNSIALFASGKHLLSDFWTSVGVVVGLVLVYLTKIKWIDSFTALIVGGWLAWEGIQLVRHSIGGLLDEEDLEILSELKDIFEKNVDDNIIQIHHVKVIRSGAFHHIDAHLVIPEFWNIDQAHRETEKFESKVIETYAYEGEMNFHLDPCRKAYCKVCELKDCPIRVESFEKRISVKLEHLRSPVEPKEFRN